MIKGIDVSDNNGYIDFAAAKKTGGVQFAILRLGYGNNDTSQDDKKFEERVKNCEALGIPWGAYIYSYALNNADAVSEAEHCLRLLKGKKPTYPICFDMEDADGYKARHGGLTAEQMVQICDTFLSTMEKNGYYTCLYASLSWLNGALNDSRLDRYDKWVAQWNETCDYKKPYGMWQYGGSTNYIESPYLNGVTGAVDKDYAFYDYPKIIKEKGLNGWEKEHEKQPVEEIKPEIPDEKLTESEKDKYDFEPDFNPDESDKNIKEDEPVIPPRSTLISKIIQLVKTFLKLIFEWIRS